jgi:subtilisin family serine protease
MDSKHSIIITGLMLLLVAGASTAGELAPPLAERMADLDDDAILKVLVVMEDPTDLNRMDKSLHEARTRRADRNRLVVTTLRESAAIRQADLLRDLDARMANKSADSAGSGVRGYTPHWIINAVVLVADVATIREIAARPDVDLVEADLEIELIEPVVSKHAFPPGGGDKDAASFLAAGVQAVQAPRVWYELGITGAGTIVGNMDSGVDGSHPMLADRWLGNRVPASQAWQDHAGVGSPTFPTDNHGHGTHTMGTIMGSADGDTIGVAPGAEWLASNAIYSHTNEFDNKIIAAFEFFADPDRDPSTADDVPDVVQNSWGVSASSAYGYTQCDSRWWEVIDNCEAAGVVVLFSAGNEGPNPMTLRNPGNRASSPTNAFTVGSVNDGPSFYVSNFSSRGPSQCGGDYQIKPEVVAPGEDVISAAPGDSYATMSGTSMAGPHVAGIVALMREANPNLDVITIKEILMDTAIDIGSLGNDNASGYGAVDAYAAVMAALSGVGSVEGTVTDAVTGEPVSGARVYRPINGARTYTDADGRFGFGTRAGTIEIEITAFGYYAQTVSGLLDEGQVLVLDAALAALPRGVVSGTVYGPDGEPVPDATVRVVDAPVPPVHTGADGFYTLPLPLVEDANYTLAAIARDLAYEVGFIGLDGDRTLDFHLPYVIAEGFETGTMTSFPWVHGGDGPMQPDITEAHEGLFSARSAEIRDGESSEISLDYYVNGDGELSFWLKTSSEQGYDGLVFKVDGITLAAWSGETDWTRYATTVSSGPHSFQWIYTKDYAVSMGSDAAWIDRIEFPGTGVEPVAMARVDRSNIALELNPGLLQTEVVELSNTGGYRLDFTAAMSPVPDDGTPIPWVSVSPQEGWVHPGVSRNLEVAFDASEVGMGTHYAMLRIVSNDPFTTVTSIPIVLTVGAVSSVDDTPEAAGVQFMGAVPNPFNPTTHISYRLPAEAEVSLKVYDVSGRLVRGLVNGHRTAGLHRERWDGRDDTGRNAASGVYFARLAVGTESQLKQMLLLR